MVTAVSFVVVLGILIFVHELGHFLLAKRYGVGVLKFALGFGPKLVGTVRDGTEYSIRAFPLGGYVKLVGQDPGEELPAEDRGRAFLLKPVRQRLAIVGAGPLFNLGFAVVIFAAVHMIGVPILLPTVGEVQQDSPAMAAGLVRGDRIVSIDGEPILSWDDLTAVVHQSADVALRFRIEREEESFDLTISPQRRDAPNIFGEKEQVGLIGITPGGDTVTKRYNPVVAVGKGFAWTYRLTKLTILSIIKMIRGEIAANNLAGPLGIARMAGEQAQRGLLSLASFIAVLSISLGILNLLPIPVLDGGHLMFFTLEGIKGKPLSVRGREIAQQVGLAFLVLLMAYAFYNDIARMVSR